MTRRVDTRTAELVAIALLTRAAFEQDRALRYASIAGIPARLIEEIFSRLPGAARSGDANGSAAAVADRRQAHRE